MTDKPVDTIQKPGQTPNPAPTPPFGDDDGQTGGCKLGLLLRELRAEGRHIAAAGQSAAMRLQHFGLSYRSQVYFQ